ncbi:Uncharacterised protein [Afipia felis]|uniref:Pentapeptide repeat-containing protein n=3 Tax=Afipia felis TaxID=1035 RepID=A0A380W7H9_AFIFE|nr:hypothetical protein HMPREF9697_00341 [Afipia felis ATCC 53690]SUU76523.1 Uncharacterised protein [Afipia felis]SUU84589.1 Uncharacterised protein [Afipia felis]
MRAIESNKQSSMTSGYEERVFWAKTFHAETLDFRGRVNFCRFDECTFIRCTLLIDPETEQVSFTGCTFKDCNIDQIGSDEERGILSKDNIFDRPLAEQRKEFDERLAAALRSRHKT